MTPTALRRALRAHPPTADLAVTPDPERRARAVESLAFRDPTDRQLRELAHRTAEHADALVALRSSTAAVAGIRARTLVRWDAWSLTFEGVEVSSGSPVLVRALRPGHKSPMWRRALARDAAALRPLLGRALHGIDGPTPALSIALPGPPLALDDGIPTTTFGLRAVVGIVADLRAREVAGLGALDPDDLELRDAPARPRVVSLAVHGTPQLDPQALARRLQRLFVPHPEPDEVVLAAQTGAFLPHDSLASWARHLTRAMAVDLTARRHGIFRRSRDQVHHVRRLQLQTLVERLHRVPQPQGAGAVGTDVDGKPTYLSGDGANLVWRADEGPSLIVATHREIQPQLARRLLRARASQVPPKVAEPAERAFVDAACRWLAATLALRDLERELGATR